MIYLSVQPDIPLFHWQVETYITNFKSVDINPNKIEVIFMYTDSPSYEGLALQQKYNTVRFFFYKDDRNDKSYIPSVRPYGLFHHFQLFPKLNDEAIFYHDSDIIFREKINEKLFENNNTWYLSDTISYVGYDYCISKGAQQLLDMIDIVKVSHEKIRDNQLNSGGAQSIIKNTTAAFWYKVYEDCNSLYELMSKNESNYISKDSGDSVIQKWCADMWAVLWNAWLFNHNTVVHPELDFSFATDDISNWEKRKILHNAGVVDTTTNLFYKGQFSNKSPFFEDFTNINQNTCSYKYVQAMQSVTH